MLVVVEKTIRRPGGIYCFCRFGSPCQKQQLSNKKPANIVDDVLYMIDLDGGLIEADQNASRMHY